VQRAAISAFRALGLRSVVSITASDWARTSARMSRSRAMPAAGSSAGASGWRRRVWLNRASSASSEQSRKTSRAGRPNRSRSIARPSISARAEKPRVRVSMPKAMGRAVVRTGSITASSSESGKLSSGS